MGLLLKFILEKDYGSIAIEFSQDIMIDDEPFFFHSMEEERKAEAVKRNNGRIRCTYDSAARLFIKGSWMGGSNTWKDSHLAITNIGAFLFERPQLTATPPLFIAINELSMSQSKARIENNGNILEF